MYRSIIAYNLRDDTRSDTCNCKISVFLEYGTYVRDGNEKSVDGTLCRPHKDGFRLFSVLEDQVVAFCINDDGMVAVDLGGNDVFTELVENHALNGPLDRTGAKFGIIACPCN